MKSIFEVVQNLLKPYIDGKIETLTNKKYIFLSDSYGARSYDGKTLIQLICELANIPNDNYANLQLNGSGFIGLSEINPFLTTLKNASISIPADEITDIIVLGGVNDITTTQTDVETAIGEFCAYCNTTYPNAKIKLAHVGRCWDKARLSLVATVSLPAWRNCTKFGANYIMNSEYILHLRSLVENDNVHPASNGVFELAKQLASAILNNCACNVHYQTSASLNVKNGALFTTVTKPGSNPILISVDNDITSMIFGSENRILAQLAAAQTFGTDITITDIADIVQTDACMVFGNVNGNVSQGVNVTGCPLDGTVGQFVTPIPGTMYIGSSDNVLFNFQNRFVSDYATHSYIGISIYLAGQSYNVPSELC